MARPIECKKCNYTFHHNNKKERKEWLNNYHRCPQCDFIYCDLPPTEKKLMELQDIYLINRSEYIYRKMAILLEEYAVSIIKQKYIKKIDTGELKNYAQKAVSLFTEYYLKNPKFKVNFSFAGLLKFKIKQACFGKDEYNNINDISLDYEFEDKNEVEYIDNKHDYIPKIEKKYDKKLLLIKLQNIIENYNDYDSDEDKFMCNIGLYFYFCFSEKKTNSFYRIIEESENKKRILKNKKFNKYNKIPDKKKGKVGKYHFIQIKEQLREYLLRGLN